jgi:hypothetical protein
LLAISPPLGMVIRGGMGVLGSTVEAASIICAQITEGMQKISKQAAFVALPFPVIVLVSDRAGKALFGVHLQQDSKNPGEGKCRQQNLHAP